MSNIVTVGKLSIETFDDGRPARLSLSGRSGFSIDVGAAAGRRLFTELFTIRTALRAAHTVLVGTGAGDSTSEEMTLAKLLLDLEIAPPAREGGS